jgi:hypothetical protein
MTWGAGAWAVAWALLRGAPAAGQAPPPDATLLWPSWQAQVAEVGLGPGAEAHIADFRPATGRCVAAKRVGFLAGLAADLLTTRSIQLPEGIDYLAGHEWRHLYPWGSLLGQALVCPSPLSMVPATARGPRPDSIAPPPARR